MVEGTTGDGRVRVVRLILFVVLLVEAATAIALGLYLGAQTVVAPATERTAAAVEAIFAVALGGALVMIALAARRGRRGARAPVVVWQILQASVGYPALSTRRYVGAALIACALSALVAVFTPGVTENGPEPD